jgi:hypothetical protein
MNFFTYEVVVFNYYGQLNRKKSYNTLLESRCYYEIQLEEKDFYFIQLIRIKNGKERKVVKEYLNSAYAPKIEAL